MGSVAGVQAGFQELINARNEIDRELTDDDASVLENIDARVTFGLGRIALVDSALAPESALNEIESQVQAAVGRLRQFQTSGEGQELVNSRHDLGQAIRTLMQVPVAEDTSALKLGAPIKKVSQDAREAIKRLRDESSQLRDGVLKEVQAQLSDLGSRLGELGESIDAQKARLDTAISTYEEQFRAAQETRTNEFASAVEARREEFAALVADSQKALQAEIERSKEELAQQTNRALELVGAIEQQNKTAEELVQAIARTGMAGGYQREANTQRWALWASYVIILVGVWFTAKVASSALDHALLPGGGIDLGVWLARFAVTFPLALGVFYVALEARRFGRRERQLRNTQLHFASLEPYLESIENPELRAVMRTILIPRFFSEVPDTEMELSEELAESPVLKALIEGLKPEE
jgi:hypothetical protein